MGLGYEHIKLNDTIIFDAITNDDYLENFILYGFYNE